MKKKILIVDDEAELVDIFVQHLQADGWETESAANGDLALAKIKSFSPDVILSDIQMPQMTGLELLKALNDLRLDIPLIFISGFRDVEKMKLAWGLGAFDFLDKPFEAKTMLLAVDNAFSYGREYVQSARKRYSKIKKAA